VVSTFPIHDRVFPRRRGPVGIFFLFGFTRLAPFVTFFFVSAEADVDSLPRRRLGDAP